MAITYTATFTPFQDELSVLNRCKWWVFTETILWTQANRILGDVFIHNTIYTNVN